jgi:hypothetical protein
MIAAVPRAKPRAAMVTQGPRLPQRLSEIEFCAWVSAAAPGERLLYHRGVVALDTIAVISPLSEPERTALRTLASRAYQAAEQGLVHLAQHRHGPDDYSYLVIARPRPKPAEVSLAALLVDAEAA